jgi:hypothetical protein
MSLALDEQLASELQEAEAWGRHWERFYFWSAHLAFTFVVVASLVSAVLAGQKQINLSWWILPLVAAIPGIVAVVNNTLRFDERASWLGRYVVETASWFHAIKYQSRDVAEISKGWTDFRREHEGRWPGFGKVPVQPSKS